MVKFILLLAGELVLLPILYVKEFLKRYIAIPAGRVKIRKPVQNNEVLIGIHDWAGYNLKRKKVVNDIQFDCGLSYQLDRVANYKGARKLNLSLTISGYDEGKHGLKYRGLNFTPVSNIGMDFQGYGHTILNNIGSKNCYLLLMNSSVEAKQVDFLDDYIDFLEQNPLVGLLGISYSSKMFQTVIRNNFTPHIQSFFMITTLDVMSEVVAHNDGKFPGQNINHKRLLIRFGEVKLSRIISKLGYQIAVVTEDNTPFIFPRTKSWFKTAYSQWTLPLGEYRFQVKHPNRINSITK
ncbi:hypothetical protein [Mucilaginibacter sp.]|uniref:hypothetical protein n=1 Tax=Mucilaginibacter sp. TaxID=1882438 RepID=UPI0028400FCD|nr:hypothetical protein [Mucilaginibacter sp.]MDR3694921.1 hypothetical protein [Mucilaginibacter sp.]